ncbi:MAG: CotH kinase family protein [Melioribacteraceae bacterium]|nr:CotH kinase family protein [Melioribacteraceae bacterium]
MKKYAFIILFLLLVSCSEDLIEPLVNTDKMPQMNIVISESEYLSLLSNKLFDYEANGRLGYKNNVYDIEIEAQGAGSRYYDKWSYHVKLKNGSELEGLTEFNLSSQIYDKAMMNTLLASNLYRKIGFSVFESNYVFVNINGKSYGLYLLIEKVDEKFFSKRFMSVYELIKLGFDSKFTFSDEYNTQFYFDKEIPEDNNYNSLNEFIQALDTARTDRIEESLKPYLNVRNYLDYHAMTYIINNVDAFANNFFLYRSKPNNSFEIIPWDFDKAFTKNQTLGIYEGNEIIKKLSQNKVLNDYYLNRMQLFLNKYFTEEELFPIINSTAEKIEEAYNLDPYLGGKGNNFSAEISELKNYIKSRKSYITQIIRENLN